MISPSYSHDYPMNDYSYGPLQNTSANETPFMECIYNPIYNTEPAEQNPQSYVPSTGGGSTRPITRSENLSGK